MKVSLFGLMFLIMFTLKLAGPMASVSWFIVTAPLWVPAALLLLGGLMAVVIALVAAAK